MAIGRCRWCQNVAALVTTRTVPRPICDQIGDIASLAYNLCMPRG